MLAAYLVLLLANVLYGTSYVATRVTLEHVPPATLAFLRLVIGALVLLVLARRAPSGPALTRGDRWRIVWMGVFGFAAAFVLANWGIAASTATNAALLLVLSGLAYASYSLFGREVLGRHAALRVTAWSILWGVVALLPLAAAEWAEGRRPVWTGSAVAGTLYLALVITAFGYLAWNWALRRVEAARAAIFLNVQPVVGALLGVALLREPLTAFTLAGGGLIVLGLATAFGSARR